MSLIALIGLPNSGKSALFNSLTKSRQRVANFPGVTVEKKVGTAIFNGSRYEFMDLPGLYTLDAVSLDEKLTRDYIFQKQRQEQADKFVLVIDATHLKKSLYLALQLKEIGQNFVIALNMSDIAQSRGQELNIEKLSQLLGGVDIISTTAVSSEGVESLLKVLEKDSKEQLSRLNYSQDYQKQMKTTSYVKDKINQVESILAQVTIKKIGADSFTEKVDKVALHPVYGPLVLLSVLILIFQLLFAWSDPFMAAIESIFEWLGELVQLYVPADSMWQSLLVDGVIGGVGGIVVFVPHIFFLFILIYFLEDFGYLGRVAFLLDYLMRKLGLPGKAVVPLLSSHACAVPGIMAARIIEDPKQRLLTMMISPLTTCSARLPVYTLLIAVIIPKISVAGFLGLPGLILFFLYFLGIVSAFIVAYICKKTLFSHAPTHLMMELPPYRMPKVSNVIKGATNKAWLFIKKAGTVILLLSILIWGLVTFPKAPENAELPDIHYSYAAKVGKTFAPLFAPLGFDWKITTALIPSFAAREVLVSAMSTVYAIDEAESEEDEGPIQNLGRALSEDYSLASLLALLVWFIFSPQCIATFGVLKKETNGYKMPIIFGLYTLAMAYGFSFLTYLIFC